MGLIADTLAQAGHEVVELVPMGLPNELKRSSKFVREIRIDQSKELAKIVSVEAMERLKTSLWTTDPSPLAAMELFKNLTNLFTLQCEESVQSTVLDKLKEEKFDLGISEAFDFCGFGLMEMIGIKGTVAASTSVLLDHIANAQGIPLVPSYVPAGMTNAGERMTLLERLGNAFGTVLGAHLFLNIASEETKIFRKYRGNDFPDLKDLVGRASLVVTNSVPILDFPHPILHKVLDIGGIGKSTAKNVSKEWNEVLSRKPHTVLISFGSIAHSTQMSLEQKKGIIEVARAMPNVQFIWKYEADDLEDVPENLFLSKWTPQSDLLADGRISLFATHGGLGSCTELAFSGVPAIVIPIMGDQPRNARMLARHGSAEVFSKYDLSKSSKLIELITKLLGDAKYKANAQKLAELLNNSPFKPKETLLSHIEFIGRFGDLPQLDAYGRHLSFVQYFLLDVVAVVVIALVTILTIIFFVIRKLLRKLLSIGKTKVE